MCDINICLSRYRFLTFFPTRIAIVSTMTGLLGRSGGGGLSSFEFRENNEGKVFSMTYDVQTSGNGLFNNM
jgi:hypothetical protein